MLSLTSYLYCQRLQLSQFMHRSPGIYRLWTCPACVKQPSPVVLVSRFSRLHSLNLAMGTADAESKAPSWWEVLGRVACDTTSQTDPPLGLHLLGANWRPRHFELKLSLSQKDVFARQKLSPQSGTISASGLSCTKLADFNNNNNNNEL